MRVLLVASFIFFFGAAGAEEVVLKSEGALEAVQLENPLWKLDVVSIPNLGKAVVIQGEIEILIDSKEWVPVINGQNLGHEDRIWIHSGAAINVYYSETEYIEFSAAPEDRWVEFSEDT
ncbi:MAG: hypothetical protein GY712_09075 [Oceanicoccus sp.]|uniref:hypothetical protein n=1 Tax=Oceanicoccus sp. TaxID=2691044 RepID=UPI002611166A|nr:hypothetical protein [Oceanicoccus sp.]MCP3908153.1 hypothetical protein [Oceanicoccus sp.]